MPGPAEMTIKPGKEPNQKHHRSHHRSSFSSDDCVFPSSVSSGSKTDSSTDNSTNGKVKRKRGQKRNKRKKERKDKSNSVRQVEKESSSHFYVEEGMARHMTDQGTQGLLSESFAVEEVLLLLGSIGASSTSTAARCQLCATNTTMFHPLVVSVYHTAQYSMRLTWELICILGAQCTNSYTLKGTVGHKAAVGTGAGLGPSSTPLPGPSHPGPRSPVYRQPCFCYRRSHTLTAPALLAPAAGASPNCFTLSMGVSSSCCPD
ncbi:hypothetical protein QTO34_004786 [Cnephaeus nilssonii]|uniref:Uncharacterized protein n=1 Tax=Cnephaeus nilssonii TaxID=3371016 RepID=A0AA40HQY0_CNENI|nr:hypothetical protein QTO34_004786 [Eptesicus nilssonii]